MNAEYLEDYEKKELGYYMKSFSNLRSGKIDNAKTILDRGRFSKLKNPVAYSEGPEINHYSVIPFYGSTIVPVYATRESNCYESNGFEARELDKLIDFSKDTGKLQFVLASSPSNYIGLDYLEPLFIELEPPQHTKVHPSYFMPKDIFDEYYAEFDVLASTWFKNSIIEYFCQNYPRNAAINIYQSFAGTYMCLKFFGFDAYSDIIIEKMMEKNTILIDYIELCDLFLIRQLVEIFDYIPNYSKDRLNRITRKMKYDNNTDNKQKKNVGNFTFPYEIGNHLIDKLTYNPGDFYGCLDIIEKYKQNDLQKLIADFDNAVKLKQIDIIEKSSEEIGIVFDNIWDEAKKIQHDHNNLNILIPVSIGTVGIISTILGNQPGILSSLGLLVADKAFPQFSEEIINKILKNGYENYVLSIFDFQKKYELV